MKFLKAFPYYMIIFASYPAIALMANNISEVKVSVAVRPVLFSIIFSLVVFFIFHLLIRDLQKSGIVTLFVSVLFFSFGHIQRILEGVLVLGADISRTRVLAILFFTLLVAGIVLLLRIKKVTASIARSITIIAVFLLVYPFGKIVTYGLKNIYVSQTNKNNHALSSNTNSKTSSLPDIYYIILDSYTRADVLDDVYHYDNSKFLDFLRNRGFFVGDCSRSNYQYTLLSLASSLNMDYLPSIQPEKYDEGILKGLIQHSKVREELARSGYRFIAFETYYTGIQIPDADEYVLNHGRSKVDVLGGYINPFEEMFIKTTGGVILYRIKLGPLSDWLIASTFPYYDIAQIELSQLNNLPIIAKENGPKFVYVHMNSPHRPFIFDQEGNLITDPGFYGNDGGAIDIEHEITGYRLQVEFLNNRLPKIIEDILASSKVPPIIIIQGDHGLDTKNRSPILYSVLLSDPSPDVFYPSISPVNTFRAVFNVSFGKDYPLLDDVSYGSDAIQRFNFTWVPEDNPGCVK
jgi:hypothetical protein